jgi:Integrase core domain
MFRSEGIKVIHTPIRAPQANAYAERFVRTIRTECLDWLLILRRQQLERVLRVYTAHYNRERPHRGLALLPPEPANAAGPPTAEKIERRTDSADSSTSITGLQREPNRHFETPHAPHGETC